MKLLQQVTNVLHQNYWESLLFKSVLSDIMMPPKMFLHVTRTCEALVTLCAHEWLLPCVTPFMYLQATRN